MVVVLCVSVCVFIVQMMLIDTQSTVSQGWHNNIQVFNLWISCSKVVVFTSFISVIYFAIVSDKHLVDTMKCDKFGHHCHHFERT